MLPSPAVPPSPLVAGIVDSLTHDHFLLVGLWGQERMVAVRNSCPSDLVAVHSVGLSLWLGLGTS